MILYWQRVINRTNFHKGVKLFHSKLHWSYQLSRVSRRAWQWVVELGGERGFDLPEWVLLTSAGFSDGPQRLMKKALQLTPGLQPCPSSPPSSRSTARLFARHQVGTAHLALSDYTSPLNNNLQRVPGARRDNQFSLPFWRLLMFQYEWDASMFFTLLTNKRIDLCEVNHIKLYTNGNEAVRNVHTVWAMDLKDLSQGVGAIYFFEDEFFFLQSVFLQWHALHKQNSFLPLNVRQTFMT